MDAGVKHNKSVSFFYDCTNNKKLLRLQGTAQRACQNAYNYETSHLKELTVDK